MMRFYGDGILRHRILAGSAEKRRESRGIRRQVEGKSRLTRDMTGSDSRRV